MEKPKNSYSKEEKIRLITEALSSDMVIGQWCDLNHIPRSTMYCWIRRFRKEEPDIFGEPVTSGEWIELSRRTIKDQNLLAIADKRQIQIQKPKTEEHHNVKPCCIKAQIGDVTLSIPAGSSESDIRSIFMAARS